MFMENEAWNLYEIKISHAFLLSLFLSIEKFYGEKSWFSVYKRQTRKTH